MKDNLILCRDYIELLKRSTDHFGDSLFLENETARLSFRKFYENVRRIAAGLSIRAEKYIILNVNDQMLFALAYFSAVITDHIVFLEKKGVIPVDSITLEDHDIRELLKLSPMNEADIRMLDPDVPCTVAFSSGTTSQDKGILLSQKNLLFDSAYSTAHFHFSVGERLIHILPLF